MKFPLLAAALALGIGSPVICRADADGFHHIAPAPGATFMPTMDISAEGGRKPLFSGKTNFPDGTEIFLSLISKSVDRSDIGEGISSYACYANGLVHKGRFIASHQCTISRGGDLPPGVYAVAAAMYPMMDRASTALTGKFGENIKSEFLIDYALPGSEPMRYYRYTHPWIIK
jgi:hypothetical protein